MNLTYKYLITCLLFILTSKTVAQTQVKDLSYFITTARASSPKLNDLQNQRKSTKIDSLMVQSSSGTQINANVSGMYAPTYKSLGYDAIITNGQSLESILTFSYDLLNKKKINNRLESVKILSDSLKYMERISVYELDRTIVDQYLVAYSSQEQLNFNNEVVLLLEKENDVLKKLTRSSVYKQSEYLTFLVTLQQQQLATKQAELQFQNDFATLSYLSGISDTTKTKLIEPKLDYYPNSTDKRFFLKRFEIDSLKNNNLKVGIKLNYKPKLGVYATAGYSSSLTLQPYKNFGGSIGFMFSVPIYDGHQKKMQYDKLSLSANTISRYQTFFANQQNQQLNLIVQQIAQTDLLFNKINEQIRFSKSLIEVNSKLLHAGDLRITDFIIAINSYLAAKNLFSQTEINRLKLINQFNYWNK